MKKLISKLKEVPDLESRHPWQSPNHTTLSINDSQNTINSPASPSHSHLSNFIGKKFSVGRLVVTVEEIIAEGGFGIVFKTRSQHDQIYALKRLNVNNKRDLKVCKREITIMSSLTHKNILSLVDSQINEHPNGIFELLMLLAYCPNNVAQLMRARQQKHQHLPESVVARILCDVTEAVARLHYCLTPVIHRDLKVENILIDERGNYVLCDFGSATARQIVPVEYGVTRTEEEVGKYTTLAYRSPEMVSLGTRLIDCKADIWALGCLLYYLCFFTLPFGDRLLAIQSGKFAIPVSAQQAYSARVLKLIQYMLTVEPSERPSVFQVSVLAFSLINKKSPVPNFDRESVPRWDDLPLPHEAQSPKADPRIAHTHSTAVIDHHQQQQQSSPSSTRRSRSLATSTSTTAAPTQSKAISTSVQPRDRPRPHRLPIGKSDSTNLFPDNSLLSPSAIGLPQSQSFNASLSANDSHSLSIAIHGVNTVAKPVIHLEASGRHRSVEESSDPAHLDVSMSTSQKQKMGHRRMVSETTSKAISEDTVKTATSLSALNIVNAKDKYSDVSSEHTTTSVSMVKVLDDDDEVDNDASFGEAFDRIRHQSELSMNGDHIDV